MPSKVNLVLIPVIGVICLARALAVLQICSRSYTEQNNEMDGSMSNNDNVLDKITDVQITDPPEKSPLNDTTNVSKLQLLLDNVMKEKIPEQGRFMGGNYKQLQASARDKQKMDRMLIALLVAYKMKFLALIPTLIGTIVLLLASNTLAGFFFSLFAAVVSMKGR